MEKLEPLDDKYDKPCLVCFLISFFLPHPLLLCFLYLLSSDKSDSLDYKYDDDGYDSESSGTCVFPLYFDEYVGHVSDLESGGFVPIGVNSKYDIVTFVVFVPIGVKSKGGPFIKIFWRSNS